MNARIRAWLEAVGNQFWVRPAAIVIGCIALAIGGIWIEALQLSNSSFSIVPFGYSGGAEGARALLGSVASSSIGVAGTIFSITIAALSLASAQMGPRLLRNFIRDSKNQIALGVFVGTFSYSLVVLRSIRTAEEGAFIPHVAVTGAIALALLCVATLIWFVHHVATSINVETVVDVVHGDLVKAIESGTLEDADLSSIAFGTGIPVAIAASGYLQAVDANGLAEWAWKSETIIKLKVRPGDFVPLGMPLAEIVPHREGASEALTRNLTFGSQPAAFQDFEYYIRQLAEVAVRALSPGINDPFTAASVLERFGDILCRLAVRHLPTGAIAYRGDVVMLMPAISYRRLCHAMFDPIRQNAADSALVLTRLIGVLIKIAQTERAADRLHELSKHADLAVACGERKLGDPASISSLRAAHSHFVAAVELRPANMD